MLYYVYILHSESADKYYIGHTPDPHKRLSEHNSYEDNSKYTAKYQPWILVAYFPISHKRGDAMKVEQFIKKQKSRKFTQHIIINHIDMEFVNQIIKKAVG